MRDQDRIEQERRRVLKMLGGSAVLLPLAGLGACSGEKAPAPAAEPPPAPEPKPTPAPEPQAEAEPPAVEQPAVEEPAEQGELTALAEDDPQAVALNYVEDASTVDAAKFPQFSEGEACSNCALWQGGDAPAGACSIFPGKSVKAAGWCSAHAPKG